MVCPEGEYKREEKRCEWGVVGSANPSSSTHTPSLKGQKLPGGDLRWGNGNGSRTDGADAGCGRRQRGLLRNGLDLGQRRGPPKLRRDGGKP